MKSIASIGRKALKSDAIVFTYLRSIVASQSASWLDLGLGFALFAWVGLMPWLATAIGAVAGGVLNCVINYRFTFRASDCDWRAVSVKYTIRWVGSLLLNAFGTQAVYFVLQHWPWLETVGFRPDGYYAASRLFVSLMVSWFWNFALQRSFVYRTRPFDATAIAWAEKIGLRHSTFSEKRKRLSKSNRK